MSYEKEKYTWTITEPEECECSNVKVAQIQTPAGKKDVFVLELTSECTGKSLIKFFNVDKTLKSNYTVKHNSDFAKLYRVTTGENPIPRFSRADQLLSHLIGYEFVAEFINAISSAGIPYFKVTNLQPVIPIVTFEWFPTGQLKAKKRRRKQKVTANDELYKRKKTISNELTKVKKKTGNVLTMEKAVTPHLNLDSMEVSIPLQDLASNIESLPHSVCESSLSMGVKSKERSFYYNPQKDETLERYHDRVINETWTIMFEE